MTQRDRTPREDEDLRALFDELRREEQENAPPYPRAHWVREQPETRSVLKWRLALAGACATVVTAGLAALAVGWPLWSPQGESRPAPPKKAVFVRKYVPPPPEPIAPASASQGPEARVESTTDRLRAPGYAGDERLAKEIPSTSTLASIGPKDESTGSPRRDYETIVGGVASMEQKAQAVTELERALAEKARQFGQGPNPQPAALPPDAEIFLGVPEPSPATGPMLAGVDGVVNPERIPETYVKPLYPELARSARAEARVILQAVIQKDGTVRDIEVLQSKTPGMGFEQAAIDAIRRWRYKPATQNGKPVEVYYTIRVDFDLEGDGEITAVEPTFGPSVESYAAIEDNPFHVVADEPLSTFSADVDTASYSNVRRFLTNGAAPPRDAVRVEEMINYFDYDHPVPAGNDPFGVAIEVTDSPWNPRNRLARITLAAKEVDNSERPAANLVFLLDVSGSMRPYNKLPLVRSAMTLLAEQLDDRDTISIVVYAGASGLALPPTPGSDRGTILDSLRRLEAGGSTAGAAGLRLAYQTARENFVPGGVNRVILATDGDFNVGVTSHSELLRIIENDAKRGVFLTALGFGMGNYKDDRLEQLADRGNGNYAYIDTLAEARKVLVDEINGTLVTVAKDVKFQVEFNPEEVGAYRLIGYENRLLAHRDFNDDTKDAGEVGAGHTVTVLYELVPPNVEGTRPEVDPLRYRRDGEPSEAARSGELFTLKVRFKRPDGDTSTLRTYPVSDEGLPLAAASDDTRFAAAVAAFGMRLRQSEPVRDFGWAEIRELAARAVGRDAHGHRAQLIELVDRASRLAP